MSQVGLGDWSDGVLCDGLPSAWLYALIMDWPLGYPGPGISFGKSFDRISKMSGFKVRAACLAFILLGVLPAGGGR
jgi:hypothetical protein